jgi:hypothetical protein
MQTAVWQIAQAQPAGEPKVGMLSQGAGDGLFNCLGIYYNVYHICFNNGAQVDILISPENGAGPTWIQLADIESLAQWTAPSDPATVC